MYAPTMTYDACVLTPQRPVLMFLGLVEMPETTASRGGQPGGPGDVCCGEETQGR